MDTILLKCTFFVIKMHLLSPNAFLKEKIFYLCDKFTTEFTQKQLNTIH